MKTVGQLLKETRIAKKLDRAEAASLLNVSESLIDALERDDYQALPAEVYIRGLIGKYVQILGIDEKRALALFRRGYESHQQKATPPQPLRQTFFSLTPNFVFGTIVSLVIIGFLVFLYWQYRSYVDKPLLVIVAPADNSLVYQDYVEVSGQTDPGTEVLINGQPAEVDADGSFNVAVGLSSGGNSITVVAGNKAGRETSVIRRVEVVNAEP